MKPIFTLLFSGIFVLSSITIKAQISTGSGGTISILPNSPSSNTNVGIGTTNPTATLEVNGDIKVKNAIFSGSSLADGQTFIDSNERNQKCRVFQAGNLVNSSNSRMMSFLDFPASNINAKSMFWFSIDDRSGNQRLRVYAETGGSSTFMLNNKIQQEFVKIFEDGNNNVFMHFPKPNSRVVIGNWGNYLPEHKFVVSGSAKIEGNILTDSNVGIGTSNFTDGSDTYRLSVKGKIRAEEIKVYSTWADYVFNEDYKLLNLKEVEKYITKNGHLPNVPSAKEINEKGLELGEMVKVQQ